jgi:hypothetical protein
MAAGAFIFSDLAKLNFFSDTNLLDSTNTFKMALVSSSWTPNNTTNEVWADVSANEIAAGAGYTAGGVTLTGVALTQSSGVVKFTSSAATWTSSGSFPAWRRGVVYASGTLNGKVNPIVGHFLGDNTPADVPITTSGNTLTVTPNASGIVSAT